MIRIAAIFLAVLGIAQAANSTEIQPLELEDWNLLLKAQNWQPLLVGSSQITLGLFLNTASATDLTDTQSILEDCGIKLISKVRLQFSSPPVPHEIIISSAASRAMVPSLSTLFSISTVDHLNIKVLNSRWVRLVSSDTTALVHASAIWSNPATRNPIVQCVGDKAKQPLIESILQADIVVTAKDKQGKNVELEPKLAQLGKLSLLTGALNSKQHSYSAVRVTLARRVGICVNSLIFFRGPNGSLGSESC